VDVALFEYVVGAVPDMVIEEVPEEDEVETTPETELELGPLALIVPKKLLVY